MKFARLFTILLGVLTVLSMYQEKALARPAERIVESSPTGSDNVAVLNARDPHAPAAEEEPDPDVPEPQKDPEPKPEPPRPIPEPPPYLS